MGSKQTRVLEKASSHSWAAVQLSYGGADATRDVLEIVQRGVGQGGVVYVVPQGFHGVEFRSVGGQPLDLQPGPMGSDRVRDPLAAVGWESIPQQQDLLASVAPQGIEETHDLGSADTAAMEGQEPSQATGSRSRQHKPDGRERRPVERLDHHRRAPLGGPGRPHGRSLGEARLVEEPEPGLQPLGFFLIWGQSRCFQRVIARSLRSLARRAGRWRLHPSCRRILQVCGRE